MIELKIFDMLGKEVSKLLQEKPFDGRYEVQWEGKDDTSNRLPSGIHLVRLQGGNDSSIQKMMLLR